MVSVIIPMYNSRDYILDAIKSVVKQNVKKEIIIIDDGSTDDSMDIVMNYLNENLKLLGDDKNRFFVRKNSQNMGVAATRMAGVKIANHPYIAFLDSDDMWADDKLSKQLLVIQKTNSDICNTSRVMCDKDGTLLDKTIGTSKEYITLKDLEKTNYINCSSVLIKKDIIMKYPMKHAKDAHEDYYAWLMAAQNNARICNIDEPLLIYRLSEGGKSRNKIKSAIMTFKTYKYAGYGIFKAFFMMFSYTVNGIKKYKN